MFILIQGMETHTFPSDIAHPGEHGETANPAIFYFTSSCLPPDL